jgi:hypothetical protein
MSELRSDTQALLSRARDAGGISANDRSRLKTAIFAKVTAASVMTTAGAAAATSTAGAAKLVAIGVVIGALGAGGAVLSLESRRPSDEKAALPTAVASALTRAPSPVIATPSPSASFPPNEPLGAVTEAPAPVASPPTRLPTKRVMPPFVGVETSAPASAAPISSEGPSHGSITDEARLLRDADRALKSGDAEGALATLALHAERYPHGVLEQERSAVRVFALCEAGHTAEARAAALTFRATHGPSPLGARVEAACGTSKGAP